jgi:hypothetical protein
MPTVDLGLLNCFYTFLLLLGVFYAVGVMIVGGMHAIHLPLHLDLGHTPIHLPGSLDAGGASGHDVNLLSLSPISIAAFVTSFGGIGIIATQGFGASGGASLLWAVGGAIAMGVISHLAFFYFFVAPQASSALKTNDILGVTAEVTAPIPGNSVGEIAYVAMGERHTATARSEDGRDIERGALVTIEGLAGTVIIVKPK